MDSELHVDVEDGAELKKEMCLSSLKRALDDVEYSNCGTEPFKKKTCLPGPKRHIRSSASGKKTKAASHTLGKIQNPKKLIQRAPLKQSMNSKLHTASLESSGDEQKIKQAIVLADKKKRTKRSADSVQCPIMEESATKKLKVEQSVLETHANTAASIKACTEPNIGDESSDVPQYTESPRVVTSYIGFSEYAKEENKEYNTAQQIYAFRKNVAFARKVVVYASDGSEYDYSDVDGAIGDNVEDDEEEDDDDDVSIDLDDDEDDDDYDYDYEDVDPDAEVASKRLNLEIADFFKCHRSWEPSVLRAPTKPVARCVEEWIAGGPMKVLSKCMEKQAMVGLACPQDSQASTSGLVLFRKPSVNPGCSKVSDLTCSPAPPSRNGSCRGL